MVVEALRCRHDDDSLTEITEKNDDKWNQVRNMYRRRPLFESESSRSDVVCDAAKGRKFHSCRFACYVIFVLANLEARGVV